MKIIDILNKMANDHNCRKSDILIKSQERRGIVYGRKKTV